MAGLVCERAGARDDADAALLVNSSRHDADLALVWRDYPGTVGPDQTRLVLPHQRVFHAHHVLG